MKIGKKGGARRLGDAPEYWFSPHQEVRTDVVPSRSVVPESEDEPEKVPEPEPAPEEAKPTYWLSVTPKHREDPPMVDEAETTAPSPAPTAMLSDIPSSTPSISSYPTMPERRERALRTGGGSLDMGDDYTGSGDDHSDSGMMSSAKEGKGSGESSGKVCLYRLR